MACVYKHICPNGKVYIGRTSIKPELRWGENGCGYLGQLFCNAIIEFGWNNIKHIILYDNLNFEESVELEKREIIKHKSFLQTKGYNVNIDNFNLKLTKGQKKKRNRGMTRKAKDKQRKIFFQKIEKEFEGGFIDE